MEIEPFSTIGFEINPIVLSLDSDVAPRQPIFLQLGLRWNGIKYHTNQLKQQPVGLEQINDKMTKDLRPQQRQSNRFCNKKINQTHLINKNTKTGTIQGIYI